MTNQYRGLAIAVLISICFILIGAGHGVGPIVLFEVMFPFASENKLSFGLSNSYDNSILASALILLIGQLLLFIATYKEHIITRFIALFVMWIALFFLTHNIFNGDSLSEFTFATGSPFLILSITLFSFDIKQYLQRDKIDIEPE